ncbi:MAG TPA: hypothetical protein IGS52_03545 [Oscillatoriaceae cyanobacterium M33_DOE_052]|uniref:Uncharacterized protein n=1 Tax=Planktothricoides sp. SpSt-374 TaxID=2282167 RepID=A0A7C3ZNH0_9CYAN|nr:hypothetical protein [Oscillatoriaceae cyanobacterium M33_DOE_052]
MLNFSKLEIRTNEKYSFVGIEQKNNQLIFHLPKGFTEKGINTFDEKRDLFFLFYRMLNVFKQSCLEKGYLNKTSDRDGLVKDDGGGEISTNDDAQIVFYSKLDVLTSILDAYDELKILTFVRRVGKSEKLDYSKLHRCLHKGIFLENGAVYLDSMDMMRREIHLESSDIVSMYCYILTEIKEQLKEEVRSEVQALGEQFRQHYLGTESSLFSEKSYQSVLSSLKDALEVIDNYTPFKDPDYWHFYDAIYSFLFGSLQHSGDGEIWGINNFHMVWEAMCLTYLVKTTPPARLLYVDEALLSRQSIQKFKSAEKVLDIARIFRINGTEVVPDAVIMSSGINSIPSAGNFKLVQNGWDDYAYLTTFNLPKFKNRLIKIAYQQQVKKFHTFNELQEVFPTQNQALIINSPLPDKFYAYWDVPDALNPEELSLMRCLNHVFFRAVQDQIFSHEAFSNWIKYIMLSSPVFRDSLFRKYENEMLHLESKIADIFISFLKKLKFFQIIDIKYYDLDYLLKPENAETIKQRSIRKQFVYEYLLQKHLHRSNSPLKDWDIKSEFWLPFYSQELPILSPGPQYMGGYVGLTQVNIKLMIDSYLEPDGN